MCLKLRRSHGESSSPWVGLAKLTKPRNAVVLLIVLYDQSAMLVKSLHLLSSSILHRFASRSIASLSYLPRRRNRVRTDNPSFSFPFLPILSRPISSGKVLAMAEETSSSTSSTSQKHTNRLAAEHSPYLLQHAHNPVINLPSLFLFYKSINLF